MCKPSKRQDGISLVELVIFIMVVSVGLAGVLSVLNRSTAESADPLQRKQALAIAEALMEELTLARFTFCVPNDPAAESARSPDECEWPAEVLGPDELGNERPFDNVRPFDNLNDYVQAWGVPHQAFGSPIVNVFGDSMAPVGNYSATVTLMPYALLPQLASTINPANALDLSTVNAIRVNVTVNFGAQNISLETIRTRYAPRSFP